MFTGQCLLPFKIHTKCQVLETKILHISQNLERGMSIETILEALKRIGSCIHETPVLTSSILDSTCGRKIFLKCELLQKTGSFKARGALNAVSEQTYKKRV